jgi:hypothetical protein
MRCDEPTGLWTVEKGCSRCDQGLTCGNRISRDPAGC